MTRENFSTLLELQLDPPGKDKMRPDEVEIGVAS